MKNFSGLLFLLAVVAMAFIASCQNNRTVRYPFGPADFDSISEDTTISLTVRNGLTYFTVDTLDQETTINATTSSQLPEGSMLYIRLLSDGTGRNVLCGTNMTCDTIKGVASKTKLATFIWDGDDFVHLSSQQID